MNKGLMILKWTAVAVVFVLVFGYIIMLLWNWLMPPVFGLSPITFIQALGLFLLSKILFGGFGKCGGGGRNHSHWNWKQRYHDKLAGMSPEEKERFKKKMWDKWCPEKKNSSLPNEPASND